MISLKPYYNPLDLYRSCGIERLLADPARHGFRIYQLLMLELGVRLHVEQPPSSRAPDVGLEDFN